MSVPVAAAGTAAAAVGGSATGGEEAEAGPEAACGRIAGPRLRMMSDCKG